MASGIIIAEVIAIRTIVEIAKHKINANVLNKASTFQSTKGKNDRRTWTITNLDDPFQFPIIGLYGADSYDENVGSNYAEFNTLGRAAPIQQFINTNADSVSFTAVLYAKDQETLNFSFKQAVTNLKKWSKFDKALNRAPMISFQVADGIGSINYAKAFIRSCSIKKMSYDANGDLYHAEVALTITEHVPYTHTTQSFDTRYHVVMDGEYHELIAAREYNNPMLGVVVRHYNDQQEIETGDIVKLPEKQSKNMSTNLIKPKSKILKEYIDNNSYYKHLQTKEDNTPPHIIELVNQKIDIRNKQYGILI